MHHNATDPGIDRRLDLRRFSATAGAALAALLLTACQPIQPTAAADSSAADTMVPAAAATATPLAPVEAGASDGAAPAAGAGVVEITVGTDAIDVPAAVPAGPTIIRFGGDFATPPEFGRLADGATVDAVMEAMGRMETEGPGPLLEVVKLYGSGGMEGGEVVYDLLPGEHLILYMPEGAAPLTQTFAVVEGDSAGAAAAPAADVQVELNDFAFIMPDTIAAGRQTWEIHNAGQQWHEMAVLKLNEGATVEDLMAYLETAEGPESPGPFEIAAFWSPMSEGNRAWAPFDLPAGQYTVVCFLPDVMGDMAPHLVHGMIRDLTVE